MEGVLVNPSFRNSDFILWPTTFFAFLWNLLLERNRRTFLMGTWPFGHRYRCLQKRMPSQFLSPNWCVRCKKNSESQSHSFFFFLFSCPFAYSLGFCDENFWLVLDPSSKHPWLLGPCLLGTSLQRKKSSLVGYQQGLFWVLWCKGNNHVFNDSTTSFDSFLDLVLFTALYWCTCLHPFKDYSLTNLVTRWSCFL